MSSEQGSSTFIFLIISLLFYVFTRAGRKPRIPAPIKTAEQVSPLPFKRKEQKVVTRHDHVEPSTISSFIQEVPKVKRAPVLQQGWNRRSSLRQAFILSEVFKRFDER